MQAQDQVDPKSKLLARRRRALLGSAASGIAGLLAGAIILSDQVWAFHYLVHVPQPVRWLLAAAAVAVGLGGYWLAPRSDRLGPFADVKRWPGWLVAAVGALVFVSLREQTHYGDGLLKLKLLATATLQDSPPYIWKAPLEGLAGYAAAQLAGLLGQPLELGIVALSTLAGVIYLLAVRELAGRLTPIAGRRLLVFAGMLALGSSQLWFGHIENYSMVTAMVTVTMALALRYFAGAAPLTLVGLAGGTAVAFHPQALFAMPALLLLLRPGRRLRDLATLAVTGAAVPAATAVMLLLLGTPAPTLGNGYVGDTQLFWTWSELVEPQQLAAAWANLWLLAPATPVLAVTAIISVIAARRTHAAPEMLPGGMLPGYYLAAVGIGLLVYNFAFQNDLARWQDWDLFAVVGPGVTAWGIAVWVRRTRPDPWQRLGTAVLLPGLAFAIAVAGCWVWVNHSYRLLNVDPVYRSYYQPYLAVDLTERLASAIVEPAAPICADPAGDPTGCQRVAITQFQMPDTGETRPAIFAHAPASLAFPVTVPATPSFLWVSPALDPLAWDWGGDGVTFQVAVKTSGANQPVELWERHLDPAVPEDRGWTEAQIDLSDYAGQALTLLLITQPGPANNDAGDRAGWGQPWIIEGTPDRRIR